MGRPLMTLAPSIDRRLSTWEAIQDRLTKQQPARPRPTITISRAFGCEGFPLAGRLATLFQDATSEPWNVYDKALIEAVANREGVSVKLLERLGDAARGLETLGILPSDYFQQLDALNALSRHLMMVAGLGSAVIVGRGGAVLTQRLKNCFHFRLDASFEFRVASIAKRLELSPAEAEEVVRVNGDQRDRFIAEHFKVKATDLSPYDAIYNNERHTVDEVAASIVGYVRQAWPEKELFAPKSP
jgi:hypothetical protein